LVAKEGYKRMAWSNSRDRLSFIKIASARWRAVSAKLPNTKQRASAMSQAVVGLLAVENGGMVDCDGARRHKVSRKKTTAAVRAHTSEVW
jgi:hypothetical protein